MEPLTSCGISPTANPNHTENVSNSFLFFSILFLSPVEEEEEQWSRGYRHHTRIFLVGSFSAAGGDDVRFLSLLRPKKKENNNNRMQKGNGEDEAARYIILHRLLMRICARFLLVVFCGFTDGRDRNHRGLCNLSLSCALTVVPRGK